MLECPTSIFLGYQPRFMCSNSRFIYQNFIFRHILDDFLKDLSVHSNISSFVIVRWVKFLNKKREQHVHTFKYPKLLCSGSKRAFCWMDSTGARAIHWEETSSSPLEQSCIPSHKELNSMHSPVRQTVDKYKIFLWFRRSGINNNTTSNSITNKTH